MLKYLIVIVLIACISCKEDDVHAELKSSYNQNDGHGHFKYGLDVANGVEAKAHGDGNSIQGEYFLLDDKGEKIRVTYTADSTGFHPKIEGA